MNINDKNAYYLLEQREYGNRFSLKDVQERYFIKNIKENNCTKTNFKKKKDTICTIYENFSILVRQNTIKLLDLKTGKYLWSYRANPQMRFGNEVKIANGKIICSGCAGDDFATIKIIDFKTGQEKASIDEEFIPYQMCVLGSHIFAPHLTGYIAQWDFQGQFIKFIRTKIKQFVYFPKLLCYHDDKLVIVWKNKIWIYEPENNKLAPIVLRNVHENKITIDYSYLHENLLICGIIHDNKTSECCIIDLKKLVFLYNFVLPLDKIHQIIAHDEWLYIGHQSGTLLAVNLKKQRSFELKAHKHPVDYLSLQGRVLISGNYGKKGKITFWDVKSLTQFTQIKFERLSKIDFLSEKVIAVTKKSINVLDYRV